MFGVDIITDADVRVPNSIDTTRKIGWLNEVNHEFFDTVKIPATTTFQTNVDAQQKVLDTYTLTPTDIRTRNIIEVVVGTERYRSVLFDRMLVPGSNYYEFDEATKTLKLIPAPPRAQLTGRVKYYRVSTVTFTTSNYTTAEPDAPKEFHWIYVLGLCARIAKAMQDVRLAQNFDVDYKNALLIAQQNLNLSRPESPGQPQIVQQADENR